MKKGNIRKGCEARLREDRKEAGFFDGRFRPRIEDSKKKYSRKVKRRGDSN